MEEELISLDRLTPGSSGVVVAVQGEARERFVDLGLVEGTTVEVARQGDPTLYRLRGYFLALRRSDACRVLVKEVGNERNDYRSSGW
ncbi:FeoA family protein [Ammonifex thiophilus]|uniref:FeoA family protein n=1 Tax=Ammonifex thiophilus TaxID=444093 RepID=UPI0014022EDD|nr:FeoA family protein [Ammonifex thiophilus]